MSETDHLITLSAGIVSAYVSHHTVPITAIPGILQVVRDGLAALDAAPKVPPVQAASQAQIRASISPDAIISFEDGRPYKSLRRHLTTLGTTPEAYRAKWGLPADYPMTPASYSARRAEIARQIGLGQVGGAARRAGLQAAE
jgi:predicted transcriptional regulator